MAMQLNPYLGFPGTCQEAMAFYADVLGGELRVMTFRDSGIPADGVMHAALETPAGFHLYASDAAEGVGGPALRQGNNVQISISGDETDTLRGYYDRLADGGQILMPLEKQMWGDVYGLVIDRFGIEWHINIAGGAT